MGRRKGRGDMAVCVLAGRFDGRDGGEWRETPDGSGGGCRTGCVAGVWEAPYGAIVDLPVASYQGAGRVGGDGVSH